MRRTLLATLAILCVCVVPHVARSTVETTTRTVTYTGNGGSDFNVSFPYLLSSDLIVTKTLIATGVETILVEDTDYTVARVGSTAGVVTTTSPVTSSYTITIERTVDLTQETQFRTQGRYSPYAHERAFDKLTMALQQVTEGVTQSQESLDAINAHIASSDDHTMYAKLAGRSGGQTLNGGTGASENLAFSSTAHATKGDITFGGTVVVIDEANGLVGIGAAPTTYELEVSGSGYFSTYLWVLNTLYGSASSGGNLDLGSTSHATKGLVRIDSPTFVVDETNNRVGIGTASPAVAFHVVGANVLNGHTYGSTASGYTWELNATSHATPGTMIVGGFVRIDETNSWLGIGTAPSVELDVAGDAEVTGDAWVAGTIYGSTAAGGDLDLDSTSNGTKGDIRLGSEIQVVNDKWLEIGSNLWGAGKCPLNVYNDQANLPVVWLWNDGNTTTRYGLEIWAGLDTPALTSDIEWLRLYDGNGDPVGKAEYTAAGPPAVTWANLSDARLKDKIEPTEVQGLATINALPMRQFNWKETGRHIDIGFVAQEVEDVVPGMVSVDRDTGMRWMSDSVLTPYLVKAVQELSAQNEALQQEVNEARTLEDKLEAMQQQLDELYWRCQ